MERVKLFLKGLCMGVADIIPGVSGGTLALILGIYAELVNTIRGLHLRWLPAVWRWMRGGFGREDGREVVEAWRSMNLVFLIVLGAGIVTAIGAGGLVIPGLLESHPEVMRALFFGLIVASLWIPFRMIPDGESSLRAVVVVAAIAGIGAGWVATSPDRMYDVGMQWSEFEAQSGETLEDISRRGPAALPGEQIYWSDHNQGLRDAVDGHDETSDLERPPEEQLDNVPADDAAEIYEALQVPQGTTVFVPQPAPWYIFVAGLIAICAMILPGISGAYILLILGAYYFVLNSLRGVLTGVTELSIPPTALFYVGVFSAGALIGILSFARLMSYLLREFPAATVGLLVGLMIGCLRGIWPFQQMVDGQLVNVVPAVDATTVASLAAAVVGAAVVLVLSRAGSRRDEQQSARD